MSSGLTWLVQHIFLLLVDLELLFSSKCVLELLFRTFYLETFYLETFYLKYDLEYYLELFI